MLAVASLPAITFIVVVLSWITFVLAFVLRKTQPRSTDRKRDPVSITGLILQGLSYAVVWAWHRPYLTPLFAAGRSIDMVVAVFAIAVTITAVLITMMAVKALGRMELNR